MKIGLLTSGELGLDTYYKLLKSYDIAFVLTDSNSIEIINCSEKNKIPCFAGNPRSGKAYNFIKDIDVDVIVSVNYLFLINQDIIKHPTILTFNIHGSLLPKYRGRTPHVWAIINGEKKTGITAHLIDENCDTGDIIKQIEVNIDSSDSGATILEKYKGLYHPLISEVMDLIKINKLNLYKQDNSLATVFGKRTPDDGLIDWGWKNERIVNWVRAQRDPYPGAFTYFNENKIVIDNVFCSRTNSINDIQNGTVIENSPNIIVKTTEGAIEVLSRRCKLEVPVGSLLK